MALTPATLTMASVGSATASARLFMYKTLDNITDLDVADYWASGTGVPQRLAAKDIIIASCADGGAILYVTSASTSASVVAIFA